VCLGGLICIVCVTCRSDDCWISFVASCAFIDNGEEFMLCITTNWNVKLNIIRSRAWPRKRRKRNRKLVLRRMMLDLCVETTWILVMKNTFIVLSQLSAFL
jgi:hypothetical protein